MASRPLLVLKMSRHASDALYEQCRMQLTTTCMQVLVQSRINCATMGTLADAEFASANVLIVAQLIRCGRPIWCMTSMCTLADADLADQHGA